MALKAACASTNRCRAETCPPEASRPEIKAAYWDGDERTATLCQFLAAAIVIVIGVAAEGTSRPDVPPALFLEGAIAAGWFAVAALLVGVVLPSLLRISTRDTVTIAVELIVKNTLLGIVLVSQVLDFEAVIPIFGFALFQAPTGIALLVAWKALERRGILLADPDVVSAEVASALARSPGSRGSERSGRSGEVS